MTSRKDTNYFCVDEDELYNNVNKLYDLYRRNNNFVGFIRYYNSLSTAVDLYTIVTGKDFKDKHFLSNGMLKKLEEYDDSKITEFFKYASEENPFWYRCFTSYTDIFHENDLYAVPFDFKKTFTKEECIKLIKTFYSQFGDDISNYVNDIFNNNVIIDNVNFGNSRYVGLCFNINALNKSYVALKGMDKNIVYLLTLVHEIGHMIDVKFFSTYSFSCFSNSYMLEITPIFFQLMFIDYLKKNKIVCDEIDYYSIEKFSEYFRRMTFLDIILDYDVVDLLPTGELVCSDESVDYTIPFYEHLTYSLGSYFALHLRRLYYDDREKFDHVFSKIMKMKSEISSTELAKMFGFSTDTFVSGKLIKDDVLEPFLSLKKKGKM